MTKQDYCENHLALVKDIAEIKSDVKNIAKNIDCFLELLKEEKEQRRNKVDKWVFILVASFFVSACGYFFVNEQMLAKELSSFKSAVKECDFSDYKTD